VIALTKSGALEYGPTVRVNCVAPGHVRTPMTAEQAAAFSPRLRYMLGCNASAPVRG